MHYLSHHWGHEKEAVWAAFEKQQISLNSTHIRVKFPKTKGQVIRDMN